MRPIPIRPPANAEGARKHHRAPARAHADACSLPAAGASCARRLDAALRGRRRRSDADVARAA
jgi:hypothetical protein